MGQKLAVLSLRHGLKRVASACVVIVLYEFACARVVIVPWTEEGTPGLHHKIPVFSDPDPGKS